MLIQDAWDEPIYIKGFYCDGNGFEGQEEHVWMDAAGFEKYHVGDCLGFSADIYRYVKTKHGKLLDFGLCNPSNIEQIEEYRIPSDDCLLKQEIDRTICNDMCTYQDQCDKHKCDDKIICVDNEWRDVTSQVLYNIAKRKEVRENYE